MISDSVPSDQDLIPALGLDQTLTTSSSRTWRTLFLLVDQFSRMSGTSVSSAFQLVVNLTDLACGLRVCSSSRCPGYTLNISSDTRSFLIERWTAANGSHSLTPAEKKEAAGYVNSKLFSDYLLKEHAEARKRGISWKAAGLSTILHLTRHLSGFDTLIQELCDTVHDRESENSDDVIVMETIDTSSLWQLSYLNIKVPSAQQITLNLQLLTL